MADSNRDSKAKEPIRDFIKEELGLIAARGNYSVDGLAGRMDGLRQLLLRTEETPASIHQHIEDILRYLAFYLADAGRHSQAMAVGGLLNDTRREYEGASTAGVPSSLGRKAKRWIQRLVVGYGYRFASVLRAAVILWLGFALVFWAVSAVTRWSTGETAIVLTENADGAAQEVRWYHYPYFSGVTLTTLGYGDLQPNTRHWWGWIPSGLAVTEAVLGYVILGLFVAVFFRSTLTHPYARVSQWMSEFEHDVMGVGKIPDNRPRLYDWSWPRYP